MPRDGLKRVVMEQRPDGSVDVLRERESRWKLRPGEPPINGERITGCRDWREAFEAASMVLEDSPAASSRKPRRKR